MVPQNKAFLSWSFARKGISPKTGRGLLQIRIYLNREKIKFVSTKEHFFPEEWEMIQNSMQASKKKRQLPDLIFKKFENAKKVWDDLEDFEAGLIHEGKTLNMELLDAYIDKKQPFSFTEFCQGELDSDRSLRPSTKRVHQNTINKLKEFRSRININHIDYTLIKDFDNFLRDLKLNANSIQGHHKRMGKYINTAINKGIIKFNPYKSFKVKGETVEPVFLLSEEIEAIEKLNYQDNAKLDRAKDLFLFACYTGLRFGDLMALSPEHIQQTSKGIEIKLKQEKVSSFVHLPLYALFAGKAQLILVKYLKEDQQRIFNSISNQKLNEFLKYLQSDAKITKSISIHTARHTFGTQVYSRTEDQWLVMRLMGHRSLKTSQIYVHLSKQIIDKKLEKIEW